MPKGIYKHRKGFKQTKEWIENRREGCIKGGKITGGWSKGTKGILKPNKTSFKKGHLKPARAYVFQKGNKHPMFRGVYDTNKKIRNSPEYLQWRLDIYKRDGYICQKENCEYCNNKTGSKLQAHHIVPLNECMALDYKELITDMDNGVTYCQDFHDEYHGRKV